MKEKKMKKPNRDLEFLFELGAFRFVDRSWRQFYNKDLANNAEHSFRVAWIALLIAQKEGVKDTGKVMKMALLHDLAESRTGDAHHMSRHYVKRDEDGAILDIFSDTMIEQEMLALWKEYEDRKSIESKIVKDADGLDVDLELAEQEINGKQMRQRYAEYRKNVGYSKFYTKTAQSIWRLIQSTDPHTWYLETILGRKIRPAKKPAKKSIEKTTTKSAKKTTNK